MPLPTALEAELHALRPLLAAPYRSLEAEPLWAEMSAEWGESQARSMVRGVAALQSALEPGKPEAIGALATQLVPLATQLLPLVAQLAVPLITSLLNPQVIQGVMSTVLGKFGKKEIALDAEGQRLVPRGALIEMISVLADRSLAELTELDAAEWTDESVPELHFGTREARATALFRRLVPEAVTAEATTADLRERIIRRVDNDAHAERRFRTGVDDTTVFPFSAICQFRIRFPGVRGVGTGFFIAPGTLLTAAHNVVHPDHGTMQSIDVHVARNRGADLGQTRVAMKDVRVHPQWVSSGMRSADWDLALIQVPLRPRNDRYFVARVAEGTPNGICVAGYAADTKVGMDPDRMNVDRDTIRQATVDSFDYSLHTTGGTSGSPVYYVEDGVAYAVGVHSRTSDTQHNRGCRLTEAKLDWIRTAFESFFDPAYDEATALAELDAAGAFDWS